MIPRVALREALSDPNLLGTAIAGDSWRSWRALLIAAMGEELNEDEREIFTKLTGREREPLQRIDQFAAVIGRRGGKSKAIATVATYIAGSAIIGTRWCPASVVSCCVSHSINGWRRSSLTTQRHVSIVVRF